MPPSDDEIAWLAEFLGMSEDAIRGDRGVMRRLEVLDDLDDSSRTFDGKQAEVEDGPADPDFNEPGRMPELDKGPLPDQRLVRLKDVKYTQNNVTDTMSDGRPISEIAGGMAREGWDPHSPDPDMVRNEHGGVTTLDHRRLVAAQEAGLDEVPAQVHGPDDPLPEEMIERFTIKEDVMNPDGTIRVAKGTAPETWGEAKELRALKQVAEPAYDGDTTFEDETYQFPPDGDARQPYLKSEKALSPAEAAKAAKKAAKEAARLERKQLGNRAERALEDLKKTDPKAAKAIEEVKAEFDRAEARREADLDPEAQQPEPTPVDPVEPSPGARGSPPAATDPAPPPDPVAPQARLPGRAPGPNAGAKAPGTPLPAAEPPTAQSAIPELATPKPVVPGPAAAAPAEPVPPPVPKPPTAGLGAPEAEAAAGADAGAGAALGAGMVGGAMAGVLTLAGDVGKVRGGQMTVGDAAKDAGAKTVESGVLTYGGAKLADAVVKGAATSGAEGALAGAGADAAAALAGGESAAAGAGAAAAGASLASVASKGGVIGGVVAGGLALIDDVGKVRDGQMTGGTATVDVGVKTAVGVGAGMAGAAAGAEIGALAGSVVPGVGNVVGFVAGAVVGGAVGYIGNKLTETETGRKVIHAAGAAVDTVIDGVETAGAAVGHEAAAAGKAVADAAGSTLHAVEDTASHVLDGASSLFDKVKNAL